VRLDRIVLLPLALLLGACDAVTGSDDDGAPVALRPESVRLAWGADTLVRLVDSRGRPAAAPTVAWASSDTLVAVVDGSGAVTARGAGTAVVTAAVDGRTLEVRVVVPFAYSLAVLEAPAAVRNVYGTAINDAGQVVGYADRAATGSGFQALLWDGGRMTVLGDGRAYDVNARGQVAGASASSVATLWSGGTRTLLVQGNPAVPPGNTWADAINDAGDVAITWRPTVGGSGGRSPGKVFLLRGGTLREVASATNAEAAAINQAGWIAGSVGSLVDQTLQGFLWRDGQTSYIGAGVTSARDVNAGGQVAGGAYRAYSWRDGSTAYGIPADSAGRIAAMSVAEGINDGGDVVGWVAGSGGNPQGWAFVWRGGTLADVNRLVPAGDWIFERAQDINNRGQIVGYGVQRATGEVRALVATPVE
jgi:probable HAF family extracellular repeat protein